MKKLLYANDLPDHYDEEAEVLARRSRLIEQKWVWIAGGIALLVVAAMLTLMIARLALRQRKRSWLLG